MSILHTVSAQIPFTLGSVHFSDYMDAVFVQILSSYCHSNTVYEPWKGITVRYHYVMESTALMAAHAQVQLIHSSQNACAPRLILEIGKF